MTTAQLAKLITEREGKKKQMNIAQVREILRILVDLERETQKVHEFPHAVEFGRVSSWVFYAAQKPAKRKAKK